MNIMVGRSAKEHVANVLPSMIQAIPSAKEIKEVGWALQLTVFHKTLYSSDMDQWLMMWMEEARHGHVTSIVYAESIWFYKLPDILFLISFLTISAFLPGVIFEVLNLCI